MPWLVRRLLLVVPSLLGITLVTFLLMDLAPGSREELAIDDPSAVAIDTGDAVRARQLDALRRHWGLVDAQGEQLTVLARYGQWLCRAVQLDLAGPGEDNAALRARILGRLPVTLLVNALALLLALAVAIPLGARLGMRAGGALDRCLALPLFVLWGLPEFLLATLLLLLLGGGWFEPLLPASGLRSDGASAWPAWRQAVDLATHLCLPVLALAVGPTVMLVRFLRASVARAAASDFAWALRAFGLPEAEIRRRVLRNGLSPLVTLLGVTLPGLVGGSVVVESLFALPGLGQLAFDAARRQDHPLVMVMTLLVGAVTLVGLILSDALHRAVDPRVRLS